MRSGKWENWVVLLRSVCADGCQLRVHLQLRSTFPHHQYSSSKSALKRKTLFGMGSSSQGIQKMLFLFCLLLLQIIAVIGQSTEPAVRVVRFQVDYPEAELDTVRKLPNWVAVMRKSVLASLRFVNKHWLICGEAREPSDPQRQSAEKAGGADCGKLQVTGEQIGSRQYRLNATFIANRDPVRNAKVEANSTVQSVLQIGLKGGIFQYTNAMKVLGKPRPEMGFEEAFFCYPNQEQVADQCRPALASAASGPAPPGKRQKREDANGKEKPPVEAVLANAMASL